MIHHIVGVFEIWGEIGGFLPAVGKQEDLSRLLRLFLRLPSHTKRILSFTSTSFPYRSLGNLFKERRSDDRRRSILAQIETSEDRPFRIYALAVRTGVEQPPSSRALISDR